MTSSSNYNRVLLDEVGFMRPVKTKAGGRGAIRDGSALVYQIEELIALGAVEVAIKTNPTFKAFRESLSPSLRKRVRLIDPKSKSFATVLALMSPISEELSLTLHEGTIGYNKSLPSPIQDAAAHLFFGLHPFLLGAEYQLQIDVNLGSLQSATHLLRKELKNPRGRAFVSILGGILSTYQPTSITTTGIRSIAADELIALFEEFVQDETYRSISEQAHSLGFPRRAKRAATLIGRYAKRLVAKPAFRKITDLCSRAISVATQVELPNSETCEALVPSRIR